MIALNLFCNHQAGGNVEALEVVLDKDTAHPLGAIEKGVSRVIDVIPVVEVNIGCEEFGFDDKKPAWFEELVEAGEFALRIVKMFDHFAADDKVIGGAERLGV